jgi:hypothetical protein
MDNKELANLTGQSRGENEVKAFKLNEVKMSGNDGKFSLREILGQKGEDGKYPVQELGNVFKGVILKMRWRLTRYEETKGAKGDPISITYMTSEFDDKNTDTVILFNNGEKGIAADLKAKHQLGSQRVLYVFVPGLKQTVRLIVKASALTAENNPDRDKEGKAIEKALGLFEYIDGFNDSGTFLHEFVTEFKGVYREDPKNPRKSYWAMTFLRGAEVQAENKPRVVEMIKEVHEKIGLGAPAVAAVVDEDRIDYPQEDINPDDIPF